ncbi:hypothetical protein KGO06_01375 [Patescibacteria group bacterium]|nr:hypothetical protein [Patescibacteria group bacterium]
MATEIVEGYLSWNEVVINDALFIFGIMSAIGYIFSSGKKIGKDLAS